MASVHQPLDLAFPSVLPATVKRFPAKPTIRPAVVAGGTHWTNRHQQSVSQHQQGMGVGHGLRGGIGGRREEAGPCTDTAIAANIGCVFVSEGCEQGLSAETRGILAQITLHFWPRRIKGGVPIHSGFGEASLCFGYLCRTPQACRYGRALGLEPSHRGHL